jgi:hypothetical protein
MSPGHHQIDSMNNFVKVSYALQRQQRAVERTLYASSTEESVTASKWADAWHRMVQARLDRMADMEGRSKYVDSRGRLLH